MKEGGTQPCIVAVIGLKKSGKTTVTEGIVAELALRGYRVGTIKSMVQSSFTMDIEGKDTYRHSDAGADFVISLSRSGIVYLERGEDLSRFCRVTRLFGPGTQFVICEGLEDRDAEQLQVICLREPGYLDETREVRGVDDSSVVAVSGIVAIGEHRMEWPVYNIMFPEDRIRLVDRLIKVSGSPEPSGKPSGPLLHDPEWRPGLLPQGEIPEVPPPFVGGKPHE